MEIVSEYGGEALRLFFASLVTWFFSRKKQKVEVQQKELDLVEKSLSIYRNIIDNLEEIVKEKTDDNNRLNDIISSLEKRKFELMQALSKCQENK